MNKKYMVFVLIPALLIHLYGCYSMQEIPKDEIAGLKDGDDIIVFTKDSTIYSFKKSDYHMSNDSLYGKGYVKLNKDSDFKIATEDTIALSNIESVQQDELKPVSTTLLVVGITVLTLGVAYLIFMMTHHPD